MTTIYIAGSSSEVARIADIREALRTAGLSVSSTWIDLIQALGPDQGTHESVLRAGAALDQREMDEASYLLYVRPLSGKSEGSAAELGYWAGCYSRGGRRTTDRMYMLDQTTREAPPVVFALIWCKRVTNLDAFIALIKKEATPPF